MKSRTFSELESKYWDLWFRYIELLQEKRDIEESRDLQLLRNGDEDSFMTQRAREKLKTLEKINDEIKRVKQKIKQLEQKSKNRKTQFRLLEVKKKYNLNNTEMTILVILLMNELEERGFTGKRGSSILSLLFPDKVERMKKIPLLSAEGKLIKSGLVAYDNYRASPLHVDFHLTEKALSELIGYETPLFEDDMMYSRTSEDEAVPPERLMRIVKPRFKMEDVVIPEDRKEALINVLAQVGREDIIFRKWGFGQVIHYGKGLVLLFYGPPGTGKTMMAEAVADHLKRELAVVRYDQVENCFVGVTEKNIVNLFEEASTKDCVLLFDEADALFSQRSQRDMKYDNRVVNILLTEIEKYEGVVILTTNYEPILDPALDRRVALKLRFDPPDKKLRRKIWEKLIPRKAPLAEDVDLDRLAEYELTGAEIKNAVLNAARRAARRLRTKREKGEIKMEDFLRAIEAELRAKRKSKKVIGFTFTKGEN